MHVPPPALTSALTYKATIVHIPPSTHAHQRLDEVCRVHTRPLPLRLAPPTVVDGAGSCGGGETVFAAKTSS